MTVVIDKKLTEQEVNALLEKIEPIPKVFDAKKYFDKAIIKEDPLKIQQEMRDE